jgi:broad specificity phosphatase PhoE
MSPKQSSKAQKHEGNRQETKKSLKTLVLIRHAHRDVEDRSRDNGLSPRGREQVQALLSYFKRSSKAPRVEKGVFDPERGERTAWISSPKKRCLETLSPLALIEGVRPTTIDLLLERGEDEELQHFHHRVREFCDWWLQEGPELTFACSHGDWIPACVEQLTGGKVQVSKGSWCELVISAETGEPALRWLIQRFA